MSPRAPRCEHRQRSCPYNAELSDTKVAARSERRRSRSSPIEDLPSQPPNEPSEPTIRRHRAGVSPSTTGKIERFHRTLSHRVLGRTDLRLRGSVAQWTSSIAWCRRLSKPARTTTQTKPGAASSDFRPDVRLFGEAFRTITCPDLATPIAASQRRALRARTGVSRHVIVNGAISVSEPGPSSVGELRRSTVVRRPRFVVLLTRLGLARALVE